jgi:F-type H+-transporting ATPase subunit beta
MDSTEGLTRGQGDRHRRADLGAGRPRDARPHHERHRRADRRARPGRREAVARSTPAPSSSTSRPKRRFSSPASRSIDLLAPYAKGGKIGLFGGAGVGKTVLIRN